VTKEKVVENTGKAILAAVSILAAMIVGVEVSIWLASWVPISVALAGCSIAMFLACRQATKSV
jgi:hypothetical protein